MLARSLDLLGVAAAGADVARRRHESSRSSACMDARIFDVYRCCSRPEDRRRARDPQRGGLVTDARPRSLALSSRRCSLHARGDGDQQSHGLRGYRGTRTYLRARVKEARLARRPARSDRRVRARRGGSSVRTPQLDNTPSGTTPHPRRRRAHARGYVYDVVVPASCARSRGRAEPGASSASASPRSGSVADPGHVAVGPDQHGGRERRPRRATGSSHAPA